MIDGSFPEYAGGTESELRTLLVEKIIKKYKNPKKIAVVSGRSSTLQEARGLGVNKLYKKGIPENESEKKLSDLWGDLQEFLDKQYEKSV